MKYKIIYLINILLSLLSILLLLFLAGVIIYELAFSDEINKRLLSKVAVLFVSMLLSLLKVKPKRSVFDKKIYTYAYKHIINDAFNNDRKSYNTLIKAIVDYNYNRYNKAIKKLDVLFNTSCTSPDDYSAVLTFKALCQEDQGLQNAAIETYEELLKYNSSCSNAWSNMGLIYAKKGDFNNAENAYMNAIKYDPDNAYGYNNISALYLGMGKIERALEYALKAIQLNSVMYQAMGAAAMCYKILGDYDNAEKYKKMYIANGGKSDAINQSLNNI